MSDLIAGLAKLREAARRYGLSQAEYDLLFDIAIAAERERLADVDFLECRGQECRDHAIRRSWDAKRDKDIALDVLSRHLLDDATTAQDGTA